MKKQFEIKTIQDVAEAVNEKNLKGFITDFEAWLRIGIKLKDNKIVKHHSETFIWNDDGDWGRLKEVRIRFPE